ncbi:MAG: hypothetical protein MJ180_00715 [Candidatus Gastranaerophilales bacterium]|nr:hypothetical protein [Candidatus Gastranaerophilales bacterium]
MEIGKIQNSIVSNQQVSLQQPSTQVTQTSPVFEYNPNSFGLLDLNVSTKSSQTESTPNVQDKEMRASELYEEFIKKHGRAPHFCEQEFIESLKTANADIKDINPIQQSIDKGEITLDDIIRQHKAESAIVLASAKRGVEIDKLEIEYHKKVRALIAKFESKKITEKEFVNELNKLQVEGTKKDAQEIIPKETKKVSSEQAKELKESVQKRSEYTVVGVEAARLVSVDDKQKENLETAYTESVPKKREEIVKAIEEVLPETLDDDSIKKVVEATEPVDTVERTYASEIIKEADYLTEEQKEQKLEVIGKTQEEIQKIAKENTSKLTNQIIEYRKEQEYKRQQEEHQTQIAKQENLKEEYKVKEFKKEKLENKESNFKKIINYLLSCIKKSQTENKNDKKSQAKVEYAKSMKAKLEDKISDIQSKKRMLENEMEMNERHNRIALSDMQDDYFKYSSSLFANV